MAKNNPSTRHPTRTWKFALIGGLASLPFTAISYWQTGSKLSLSPVLFGGLLAGYLAKRKTGESSGVGIRTGLVGGLPLVWMLFDVLMATSGLSGPSWFVAGATVLTIGVLIGVAVVGFGIAGLIAEVGVRVGSRLAGEPPRRPASVPES